MVQIEARVGIPQLGDSYRCIGFNPPLSPDVIDTIHRDSDELQLGLQYIRLKTLITPDKIPVTETTTYCGSRNQFQHARQIAAKIIEIACENDQLINGGVVNGLEYNTSRRLYLFGIFTRLVEPDREREPLVIYRQSTSAATQLAA